MAVATHKTLSDGAERWKSTSFYLSITKNIVCNVLRILLYIVAYLMRKCSSLFESLSDNLKTVEKPEDSPEKTIENRCNVYSFSNQTNKNEEPKEKKKVINVTVNELMENECNSYSNCVGECEEQKEANKVISDVINELIDDAIKESDSQYYDVQQKPKSQTPEESRDNSNSVNSEEKVKEKIITSEDIGSIRVRKRHPIKNTAMLLITKTMNENKLKDKLFKFETELYKDKMSNKEIPNGNPYRDIDNIFINKSDSFKREIKLSLKNEPEKTDCFEVANNNDSKDTSNDSSSMYQNDSKNFDILKIIEPLENEWKLNENEKISIKNNVDLWENDDGNKGRNPITKTENMLNIFEVKHDIFGLPSTFSLAHCVSEDFHNSVCMTADFKYKFGQIGALMDQRLRVGNVGHITHNEQHIFYLVVKRKMSHRPLLSNLEIALYNLRDKMNDLKLTKLAIPKYGLDNINMIEVKELISKIFTLSNIEVTICLTSSKLDIEHINLPKVNYTQKHLWEMEKQTDIIIFINMSTMYSENWNDKVVEHINAKYPFKERLLNDINIKPMAHGDLLIYKFDTEILFCIFINPLEQNPLYYRGLEKAFLEMKSQLTGYRYFGIQQEPLYKPNRRPLPLALHMLKSIFNNQNAEIWVCGDTEQHRAFHYQQYRNIVNNAIEQNQKKNLKIYTKSKYKPERRKHSNNSRHELSERHYSKNILDVNTVTNLNQEHISVDNFITENWDN